LVAVRGVQSNWNQILGGGADGWTLCLQALRSARDK
jgi:hypothetical protein